MTVANLMQFEQAMLRAMLRDTNEHCQQSVIGRADWAASAAEANNRAVRARSTAIEKS